MRLITTISLLAFIFSPLIADENDRKELYLKGLEYFHMGQADMAAKTLEKFLAQNPDADEVLRRLNESSTMSLIEMHHNAKLKGIASRILKVPEESFRAKRLDDERTLELVRDIERRKYSDDGKTRWASWDSQKKLKLVGAPAVPFLIKHLGDQHQDILRSVVFQTLVEIDVEAVLPLIKGLQHPDPFTRMNIAAALGVIGDLRAVPALKETWETSQESLVKTSCEKALLKITGQSASALPESKLLYLKQAEDYYRKHPRVMHRLDDELFLIWSFNQQENTIRRTQVPAYIWHLEMAEDTAFKSLEAEGALPDEEIFPLLTVIHFSQLETIEALIHKAKMQNTSAASLEQHRQELIKADAFGSLFGPQALHEALRLAINDHDSGMAKRINQTLVAVEAELNTKE